MSPEAVRGEPVDRRSDIFSVGVMLWEAATGLRLWQDHDEVAVYRRLATGDLPLHPPSAISVNPQVMRIALRALAVDPYQRYGSAEEMQREIENVLVQLGKVTRAPALAAYMDSFFTVEREKFQAIVDDALSKFPTRPVSQRRLIANELTASYPGVDPSEPPTTVSNPSGGTFRTTAYDVPLTSSEVPEFRPPRRGLALAAIAAAFAVGVAGVANTPNTQTNWLSSLLRGASTATVETAAAHVTVAATAAPVAPPPLGKTVAAPENALRGAAPGTATGAPSTAPPANITVVFSARPAEARFYLDGEPIEGNPATLHRRSDARKHRVRIEAPGYATIWKPIDFDRDVTRQFDLAPYSAPPAAAKPARTLEQHEETPKARRGKRVLDRDDPWAP